jgi:hypothetical protein
MIALKLNTIPARRALTPDLRPLARVQSRARRKPSTGFGKTVLVIGGMCTLALAYVAESANATQAGVKINQLKAQQAQLLAEQQQIRYQISLAQSAGRLDQDAQKLGLVPSGQWQYVGGATSPVALSKGDPAPAPESRSWIDQLAIALGRPTEAEAHR